MVKIPQLLNTAELLEKKEMGWDVVYYKGEKVVVKEEMKRDKEKMMKNMKFLEKWIKEL